MAGTKIKIEVDTATLKQLVVNHIIGILGGDAPVVERDVKIEVKSKQNYRNQEWENGEFRAVINVEK